MTDTVLHSDLATLDRTTPTGRIKAQLLDIFTLVTPTDTDDILHG